MPFFNTFTYEKLKTVTCQIKICRSHSNGKCFKVSVCHSSRSFPVLENSILPFNKNIACRCSTPAVFIWRSCRWCCFGFCSFEKNIHQFWTFSKNEIKIYKWIKASQFTSIWSTSIYQCSSPLKGRKTIRQKIIFKSMNLLISTASVTVPRDQFSFRRVAPHRNNRLRRFHILFAGLWLPNCANDHRCPADSLRGI